MKKKKAVIGLVLSRSLIMNLTLQFPKPFHESDFFSIKKWFFDLTTFLCFV
jgi:hypothetical protein